MKASQLIMALAEGIKEHGDVEVECLNVAGDLEFSEGVVYQPSRMRLEVTTDLELSAQR